VAGRVWTLVLQAAGWAARIPPAAWPVPVAASALVAPVLVGSALVVGSVPLVGLARGSPRAVLAAQARAGSAPAGSALE
jgi:hypothetical protein